MSFSLQIFQFVLSGITIGSTYALIAIGFSLIHNATGIVNFAQGEFVMLGGMFMVTFYNYFQFPLVLSFFLTMLSVAATGLLLEVGPLRRARSKNVLVLVMITLAASISIRGLSMFFWGKNPMTFPSFSGDVPIFLFGATVMPQSLWIFGVTVFALTVLSYFLKVTITGKAMRAVAANPRSARLAGISVERMVLLSFVISGALGAVAGIILTPMTTTSYNVGVMLGLKSFAAAILGGYGSIIGAVVGGLLLGVMESLTAGLISSEYKDALAFLILLTVLFFKPNGILGKGNLRQV